MRAADSHSHKCLFWRVLPRLNVPETSPDFKVQTNYHLFKLYGEEFSAVFIGKKTASDPHNTLVHAHNLHIK